MREGTIAERLVNTISRSGYPGYLPKAAAKTRNHKQLWWEYTVQKLVLPLGGTIQGRESSFGQGQVQ